MAYHGKSPVPSTAAGEQAETRPTTNKKRVGSGERYCPRRFTNRWMLLTSALFVCLRARSRPDALCRVPGDERRPLAPVRGKTGAPSSPRRLCLWPLPHETICYLDVNLNGIRWGWRSSVRQRYGAVARHIIKRKKRVGSQIESSKYFLSWWYH